jgi:hypothetical protein
VAAVVPTAPHTSNQSGQLKKEISALSIESALISFM